MRWSLLSAAFALSVNTAGAQSGSDAPEPIVNISIATGVLVLQDIEDGPSNSRWDFGVIRQHRASIDRSIGNNTSVGLTLGYAALPMHYEQLRPGQVTQLACNQRCTANADLWTLGATLRVVSGTSLHHLIELNAMVNQFSNFREEETNAKLAPLDGDRDVLFTAGYGFGWAASRHFQIALIGDVGFTVHTRAGRESDLNRVNQLVMARLMVRSGIGR